MGMGQPLSNGLLCADGPRVFCPAGVPPEDFQMAACQQGAPFHPFLSVCILQLRSSGMLLAAPVASCELCVFLGHDATALPFPMYRCLYITALLHK